ncbi:hypothetical protein [Spirillospora sp. NPDC029432]|uniref:hypothetical protein n=1 Tax=Spirillospora sp. NPDC029432 TaxID=3154599 RepID=UPI0034526A58
MRSARVIAGAAAFGLVVTGCQGGGEDAGGEGAAAKRPSSPAAEVALPDDPKALADVLGRRIGASRSAKVSVSTETTTNQGKARTEISGVVAGTGTSRPSARITLVQTGGPDAGTSETIVLGDAVYVRQEGEEYEPGKRWLRITRADLQRSNLGPSRAAFEEAYKEAQAGIREATADKGLAALRHGTLKKPPYKERLGGEEVRRYDGTSATAKLAGQTGDAQFRTLADAGVANIPWSVWVDRQGLPRQLSMSLAAGPTVIVTTARYSDWGKPAAVTAPDPAQVATLNV